MTGNAELSVPPSPIPVVWGVLEAELLPQPAQFSEMRREIELFKICFIISVENILPGEKSLKNNYLYSISQRLKTLWICALSQDFKAQHLISHLTPVSRKVFFPLK